MADKGLSKFPRLSIEQEAFAIWCQAKGISASN
jgi:hypothetical protein